MKVDDIHRKVRVGGDQGAGDLCVRCRELWPCETIVALKQEREELEGSIDHLRECADGSARRAEQWAAKCDRLIAERDDIRTQLAASEQARGKAEKERDGLRVERDHQADLLVRHRAMGAIEDVWRWEGDQQRDDLESLTGGVLIAADDLRDVFARAARAEEERDQIVKALRHFHMPASFGSETCGMCGFNLRHALHFKAARGGEEG